MSDLNSQEKAPWRMFLPWMLMGIAILPMMAIHARNLWYQPQYQFFPILYLVFAWLVWGEKPFAKTESLFRARLGEVTLWISGLVFIFAVLLYSPYLGQLSAILWVFGGMLLYLPKISFTRCLALMSLLVLTAIPHSLSVQLAQLLQRVTTTASSGVLDMLQIPHVRSGNIIAIVGKDLFVDEACSGIHSLFAAMCVVIILSVVYRSPLFIGLVCFLAVPFWAVIGNVVRITSIALAYLWWKIDLSHGWQHDAIGHANFLLIGILLWVWHRFVSVLFSAIPTKAGEDIAPSIQLFNNWFQWPRKSSRKKQPLAPNHAPDERISIPSTRLPSIRTWMGAILILVIGAINLLFMSLVAERFLVADSHEFDFAIRKFLPSETDFASVPGSWGSTQFVVSERDTHSIFGNYSHIWSLRSRGGFQCTASLDFPFFDYHDVSVCYRNSGWEIRDHKINSFQPLQNQGEDNLPMNAMKGNVIEFDMNRVTSKGFTIFGLVDSEGELVDAPHADLGSDLWEHFRRGPLGLFSSRAARRAAAKGYLQFQVFSEKTGDFTEQDKAAIREQFSLLLAKVRSQSKLAFQQMEKGSHE